MYKKHPTEECCDGEISGDELNMIDIISAVHSRDADTKLKRSSCRSFHVHCFFFNFAHLLSRGKLSYLGEFLFHFAVISYVFSKTAIRNTPVQDNLSQLFTLENPNVFSYLCTTLEIL